MNSSKKLAALVALALSTALAGTGCVAQPEDADENTEGQDQAAADQPADTNKTDAKAEETGTAKQKCGFGGLGWGGWGGWGGCGGFGGWGGWGGGCGCGGFGGWGGWGGGW